MTNTKTMINKLTPAQEAKIPEYIKKWINMGIDTSRLNYDETLDIIHDVQRVLLKVKPTPVYIVNNPVEAWIACHLVRDGVDVNNLSAEIEAYFNGKGRKLEIESYSSPYLSGAFDANIWAFYDFFKDELNIDYKETTEAYMVWRSTHKLGQIYPLENVVIVSQKPTSIKLNQDNVAHSADGPAITYAGYGMQNIYMINGVRVPEWLACTPSNQLKIEQYNDLTNADHRMCFVWKMGVERMLSLGKKLDSYENYPNESWWTKSEYELWDMSVLYPGVDYAPHLKMLNQTVGVWHVESVSPKCTTLSQAIAERLGDIDLNNYEIVGIA